MIAFPHRRNVGENRAPPIVVKGPAGNIRVMMEPRRREGPQAVMLDDTGRLEGLLELDKENRPLVAIFVDHQVRAFVYFDSHDNPVLSCVSQTGERLLTLILDK